MACDLCFEPPRFTKEEFPNRCELLDLLNGIVRQQSFVWPCKGVLSHRPSDFDSDVSVCAGNQRLSEFSQRMKGIKWVPAGVQKHRRDQSPLFRAQTCSGLGDCFLAILVLKEFRPRIEENPLYLSHRILQFEWHSKTLSAFASCIARYTSNRPSRPDFSTVRFKVSLINFLIWSPTH